MSIFLELFITFFYIGATTFGGGYAMIPLVREQVLSHGWLTEAEFINMIAVSESTPGPIAVNMATFVGSSEGREAFGFVGGILGAALATIGVILPAFIIMMLISTLIRNFIKYKGVQAFLGGVRPAVVGLIVATALTMFLSTLLGFADINTAGTGVDYKGIIIFAVIVAISNIVKKIKGKKPSPILMIVISAVMGIALYSF